MIKATELQYHVRKEIHRINSGFDKAISVPDIDAFINESIDFIYEKLIKAAEVDAELRQHLRLLEIHGYKPSLKESDNHVYFSLPEDFYKILRVEVYAGKKDCGDKLMNTYPIQNEDKTNFFKSPFRSPSYEWGETAMDEYNEGYKIYKTDFTITDVIINYIKKPQHIQTPSLAYNKSYIDAKNNTVSEDVDFNIDSTFIWRKVYKLAALNILNSFGQVDQYQLRLNELIQFLNIN